VKACQLDLGNLNKTLSIHDLNILIRPHSNEVSRLPSTQAVADGLRNGCAQLQAISKPKRIWFPEGLPYRHITCCRSLVGPDEHVLKKIDLIQLINA